jgi:integrase
MSARPQPTQLQTRTAQTEAAYIQRYRQLNTAARSDAAALTATDGTQPPFTANAFVDWLLAKQRAYRANSWRQVRASACFGMKDDAERNPQRAPAINAAIAKLKAAAPERDSDLPPRTSSTKAKGLTDADLDRICHAALASRSPNSEKLVLYLPAATLCGLRPCEWPGAIFRRSKAAGFEWELIVRNAKNSNDRSTGEMRTLRWPELADNQVEDVAAWIALSRQSGYHTLLGTLASLLARLAKGLFSRRKKIPTLYSTRHEAAARWKATFVVPDQSPVERTLAMAVVAALLGHVSDETASRHYGRPTRGTRKISRFPSPHADVAEVAKVRQRFTLLPPRIVEKTSDRSEEPNTLPPPSKKS